MLDATQEVRIPHAAPPKRSPVYLLTGLILGLILGVVYAWLINPVVYENTTPTSLGEADKDHYRSTIAQVYAATGDLQRAAFRLAVLADSDPIYALGAQAQRALANGNDAEAHALALLATALQGLQPLQNTLPEIEPPLTTITDPAPSVPTHTLPVPTSTP